MPVTLPEYINPWLFRSADGRMTTEAATALAAAQSIVTNGRNIEDPEVLTRALLVLMLLAQSQSWPPSLTYPTIGMIAGLDDRKVFRGTLKRRILGLALCSLHATWENNLLKRYGPAAPGWNDYYMALWFVTGAAPHVNELHQRATFPASSPQDHMTRSAAIWMMNSVRRQYADFDAALKAVETRLNESVPVEDPTPAPWPGVAV